MTYRWRWPLLLALVMPHMASGFPPVPKGKDKKPQVIDVAKAIQGT